MSNLTKDGMMAVSAHGRNIKSNLENVFRIHANPDI